MSEKFMFYENIKTTADTLPDDVRLKFYDALTNYVFNGVMSDDYIINALIKAVNPVLYVETRGGVREGCGRKSKLIKENQKNQIENFEKIENQKNQNNQKEEKKNTPLNPQKENNKNIYNPENNKLFSAPKEEKSKKFVKPTVEEITLYCRERQNTISAENFYNFYESKGWRIGSSPMKDWKAAVRTWEAKEKTLNAAKGLVKSNDDFWRQLGC